MWFHGSRSRSWSGVTASFNRSANARATIRFTGTSVTWISLAAYWAGTARVYVDGQFVQEVDLFLRPPCTPEERAAGCVDEQPQAAVFTASGLAPGSHTFMVEVTGGRNPLATDNAVVVDAFDVGPAPAPTTFGRRFEETTASYTSGWSQGDQTTTWSGGTSAVSSTPDARATFSFTGTSVSWIGHRGPGSGIARVWLDGSFQAEIDTYSPSDIKAVVYTATDLAPATHTMVIEVTGRRNPRATGERIVADAIDVGSRFEDRDPSIVYAGEWRKENPDKAWSGTSANVAEGTAAISATAGAQATFQFTGTSVSWIGFRGPVAGIAGVFLDGAFAGQIDMYSPTEELRVPVFTAANLSPGTHTLRIDVTGQRNPAAMGAFVVVDAFDVTLPPTSPVTRIQDIDPSVSFTPTSDTSSLGWTQASMNLWSGERATFTSFAGARATFTFTGTSIRWIGARGREFGIARVTLDGGLPIEIDTFAPGAGEVQAVIFSATGLASGSHTLTIEVTGLKNPAADAAFIMVDAFDIR